MVGINNKKLLKTILQIVIILIIIIPKQELATSKVKLGDINNDSKIDQIDMLLVLRHISATANNKHDDWILTEDKFKAADITENGTIDSNDMLFLLRYIAANNSPDEIGKKHPEWLKLEKEIEVTGILLNKTDIELEKGKTETLKATIEPGDATNKEITWTSSNNTVVEVDKDGKITGKANGTAQITAETKSNGKKALCKVKVITSPTSIKINKSSVSLDLSGTKTTTLKATIEPSNATNKEITWTSSNTKVATVDKNGKVTAKGNGTTQIIAETKNKKKATCKVTITTSPTSIKLNKSSISLDLSGTKTETLKATIEPTNTTNKNVTWTSSNNKIATIDKNGKLTAKNTGTVTITAKTKANGKKATCKVTIIRSIKSIKLSKSSLTISKGNTTTLKATINPTNATNKTLTWTSSNTKVATVNKNGKITAKSAGSSTITVKSSNGKKATCKVTVKSAPSFQGVELKYSARYNVCSTPLTPSMGVKYFNGHKETYYSQRVLPGGGLYALNNNGRHVANDGTIRDKDGYIAIAANYLSMGSTIMTSLGPGKVYDTGDMVGQWIDIYVDW